ncbi:MAG TPA: hypothetical protein PK794_06005, partial [Armatimonadota bacterium]|nr:hypothetical protein [Armatimonadota bacterium]
CNGFQVLCKLGLLPGFDGMRLMLMATHTHTGPVFTDAFYTAPEGADIMLPDAVFAFLVARLADAAAAAWHARAPGAIARGYGHAVVGHNRRASYLDGTARMYGQTHTPNFSHLEGSADPGVNLLYTFDAGGTLTGVVANLSCPSQETENDYTLSADFWHEVRVELASRLGEDVYLLPQCAPAGDQSPHLLLHQKEDAYMLARRGLTRRQEIGRRIAVAVEDVYHAVKDDAVRDAPLRHHVEALTLPGRTITEADYRYALAELETVLDQDPKTSWAQHRLRNMIAEYEAGGQKPPFTLELHAVRLGDIAFATSPFELYLDYALRIQARSPAEQTFLSQISCGWGYYLPTEKAVAKHYGGLAADNFVGPDGGQLLVERTLAALAALWESAAPAPGSSA